MGAGKFIILVLLIGALAYGSYLLWSYVPSEPIELEPFSVNFTGEIVSNGTQFYPNLRYKYGNISYSIADICNEKSRKNAEGAFGILSESTILEFYESSKDPQIKILCSDVQPEPEQVGYFVAGEGGPEEIIDNKQYHVILSGKVSLFRVEKCPRPQIALHEILHAFGFDHNNNSRSILYPLSACNQIVDEYIIEEINRLYSIPSEPDLAIENLTVKKRGRYIDFQITVANIGLEDSVNSTLIVSSDKDGIKNFSLGPTKVGTRQILTVENLISPRNIEKIVFDVEPIQGEKELSKENNMVEFSLQ